MPKAIAQLAAGLAGSRVLRAVVVDVVLVAVCWLEGFTNQSGGWNRPFALSVLALVAVPLRRYSPEAALVLGVPALGWAQMTLAPAVVLFTLGQRQRRTWLVWLLAGAAFVVTLWPQWDPGLLGANSAVLLTDATFIVGAVSLGALRTSRALERAQRQQLQEARAGERAAAAAAARAEERAHLAREMHDVVSHHVTLIAVQAGALQMTTGEDRSRQAAAGIRALASTAVNELRQVLGVLRQSSEGGPVQVAHTLAELDELVAVAAFLGQVVALDVDRRLLLGGQQPSDVSGSVAVPNDEPTAVPLTVPVAVPTAVQGTAYRIVQEGLTNARKHAPGATVRVVVRVEAKEEVKVQADGEEAVDGGAREVRVEVLTCAAINGVGAEEAASGVGALPPQGAGLGLVGLAERAASVGGSVSAGVTPEGVHRLVARLPLQGW